MRLRVYFARVEDGSRLNCDEGERFNKLTTRNCGSFDWFSLFMVTEEYK